MSGELEKDNIELRKALQEQLNYKDALDAHAIVAATDVRGRIIYVNDLFCEISKYSRAELLGKDHNILKSGLHDREFFKTMWKTIGSGKIWRGEIKNKAKDGSFYWVKTTIMPFRNVDGKIAKYVSIRTDITDKIRAEEKISKSRQRLQVLTQQLRSERLALRNKNIALNELIDHLESEKEKIRAMVNTNIETVLYPLIDQIKTHLQNKDKKHLDLIRATLADIVEPIANAPGASFNKLTPKELQICSLIKKGMAIKEIAQLMHLSPRTIGKHRENIREKLGLKSKKINLTTFLIGEL